MSQFLHLLHGWINVCNEICLFGSNSNVEVDVHELVVHVRLGISISFDDSFIASAETKGLDWETHDVHEGKALPSWASPLPIFLCSEFQRISQRIFWLVCSDHASAVSALARCFQRSLLLGFCGISALSLIQSWCVVGEKEHGKETCMFLQHFFFVISMWSWLVLNDGLLGSLLEVIVLACDLEHSLQCMVFDVMPIVLPVSIDWCDLFRQCVHVQAGFDRSSMDRLGCGFSITLWIPANFLSLPNLGDEFFFETLFCSLRFANNHMLCQRIVFGEQEYSRTLWRWRAYDLDLGLDMTLRPANLLRWNFNFFVPRKPHISDVDVGCAEHGNAHRMIHICIRSSWHCWTQEEEDLVLRSLFLWGSLRAAGEHILRNSSFLFSIGKFSSLCHDLRVWLLCECIHLNFVEVHWKSLPRRYSKRDKPKQSAPVSRRLPHFALNQIRTVEAAPTYVEVVEALCRMDDLKHWTIRLPARRGTWRSSIFEPLKKRRHICRERQFTSSAMGRLSTGFLGRVTSSLSKVKAALAQGPMRKFSCLCRLVVRTSSTCLCWKRILYPSCWRCPSFFTFFHGWINVCNEISPFECGSRRSCPSWHLHHDGSFIVSAETKGLDWKTHELPKCSWGESLAILGFTTANFPLFRIPKNFSKDFLVCVFRSRKCGFSIGVLFPTIIVVRIFWNFHVEFNWKLVCRWWEGTWQGNMRVSSTFLFRNGEVGSFWKMVLGSLLQVIVLAGDLEHSWQCMVFDMMPIALQVSIDWLMRFGESHVLVIALVRPCSGGVWPKFNGSVGMWFFRSLCGCQPVFCLSQILVMSSFLKLYFVH